MGGLLHLFDFNNVHMARKFFTHKSHDDDDDDDLEAPRNSFELQTKPSQSNRATEDLPYLYGPEEEWYERSCYPIEASMKKLINDELSERSNTKQNTPSIVAKLMGVDVLPLDVKSAVWPNQKRDDFHEMKVPDKERHRRGFFSRSKSSKRLETDHSCKTEQRNVENCEQVTPLRREHPQEDELQKFKKEFKVFQAARIHECSRIADISTDSPALETLENEKIACKQEKNRSYLQRCKSEVMLSEQKERSVSRSRSFGRETDYITSLVEYDQKMESDSAKIVILKPGPQRICGYEDSLSSSSGTLGDRGGIENFLEEVKERLKHELQGRSLKRSSSVRGSGIETPFSEKPSFNYNKQIVPYSDEGVGVNLRRCESTRSYKSKSELNAADSPRRLFTDRLRNVLKRETSSEDVNNRLQPTLSQAERRLRQTDEILKDIREEMRSRSFRRSSNDDETDQDRDVKGEMSSRNLIRSLSAPVSGTSFGKLLLEDRHVLTGGQIRRKQEAVEHVSSAYDPSRRKQRSNFRKKVSNFRSSLRGRLFGKKIRSMLESNSFEHDYIKDFVTGPRFTNFYDRIDNSTEVPPSPASVCSSTPEEFWRNTGYLSPVSTPDVTLIDENGMPQVFGEISSNLIELRKQIDELESEVQPNAAAEQETDEPETIHIENPTKAYVRDLLVCSGLYEGSSDKPSSRKGSSASNFKETEHAQNSDKDLEEENKKANEDPIDQKLLFDLLNESLANVLGSRTLTPLHGGKLLESVWKVMEESLYPQKEDILYSTLDSVVAWDLGRTRWDGSINDEIDSLGQDVECRILEDLVDECLKEMGPRHWN